MPQLRAGDKAGDNKRVSGSGTGAGPSQASSRSISQEPDGDQDGRPSCLLISGTIGQTPGNDSSLRLGLAELQPHGHCWPQDPLWVVHSGCQDPARGQSSPPAQLCTPHLAQAPAALSAH